MTTLALSPDARYLAAITLDATIFILPLHLITKGAWDLEESAAGVQPMFPEDGVTELRLGTRSDCLALPTSATWHIPTHSPRPFLIFSNKAGDIFFVDLLLRKLSVSLQAPQSIHHLQIIRDASLTDVHLLVTGFAGTQWLVPLEQEDQSLRETLGKVIPSQLRELGSADTTVFGMESHSSPCVAVLKTEANSLHVYNTASRMMNPAVEVKNLPPDTWCVHYADSVIFCLSAPGNRLTARLNFPTSDIHHVASKATTEAELVTSLRKGQRLEGLPEGRVHCFVKERFPCPCQHPDPHDLPAPAADPWLPSNHAHQGTTDVHLPTGIFLTQKGVFRLKSLMSGLELLLTCLHATSNATVLESVTQCLDMDYGKSVEALMPRLISLHFKTPALLALATTAHLGVSDTIRYWVNAGRDLQLLPHLEGWIATPNIPVPDKQLLSQLYLTLTLKAIQGGSEQDRRLHIHNLNEFLRDNEWYLSHVSLEKLLEAQLWSSALTLLRAHDLAELAAKHLSSLKIQFPSRASADEPLWNDALVELVTLPSYRGLLTGNGELAAALLSRVESVVGTWTEPRHLRRLLHLLNPQSPEVESLLQQAAKEPPHSESGKVRLATLVGSLYVGALVRLEGSRKAWEWTSGGRVVDWVPLAAGHNHALLLTQDGLLSWGSHKDALFCTDASYAPPLSPIHPPHSKGKLKIQGVKGAELVKSPAVKINLPTRISFNNLLGDSRIVQVAAGTEHSLALSDSGAVLAWGENRLGQLGCGDRLSRHRPTFVQLPFEGGVRRIEAGWYHSAAISDSGEVCVWGWGVHGQLGRGSQCLDDALSPVPVPLPRPVLAVTLGYAHSLFLTTQHQLYVCGNNTYGQLGLGDALKRTKPTKIKGIGKVMRIASGLFHSHALTEDLTLLTWGVTPQSLKFKALLQKRKAAAQAKSAAAAEEEEGKAKMSDLSSEYSVVVESQHLSPVPKDLKPILGLKSHLDVVDIKCGFHHSALLTSSGQIYTWGKSLEFQLGHGDKKERLEPWRVSGGGREWAGLALGSDFSLAVDGNGSVWGWGRNDAAQLGFESVTEEERGKLASKTLTFQRPNKATRTIRLPSDPRVYVPSPRRCPGLVATPSHLPDHQPPPAAPDLIPSAILLFANYLDAKTVSELCVEAKEAKLGAYVWMLKGDLRQAVQTHCAFLEAANDQCQVSDAIHWYQMLLVEMEDSESLSELLGELMIGLPSFHSSLCAQIQSHFNTWKPAIHALLQREPERLEPLDSSLKWRALEGQTAAPTTPTPPVLIKASTIAKETARGGSTVWSYGCGHSLGGGEVESEVGRVQSELGLGSWLPRTLGVVGASEDAVFPAHSALCPPCLRAHLHALYARTANHPDPDSLPLST